MRIEHVKAHQDEKVGPLTFEQYYNVKVDLLAKKGCDERHCEEYSDYHNTKNWVKQRVGYN